MSDEKTPPVSDKDPEKSENNELIEKLKDPLLLNLLCGIFALERAYQVLTSNNFIHPGFGHFAVIACYVVGFLFGLSGKMKAISYFFLGLGTAWLFYVLAGDICAVQKANIETSFESLSGVCKCLFKS